MTDDEKKELRKRFDEPKAEEDLYKDDWTEEEILAVAKKILKRMGIDDKKLY